MIGSPFCFGVVSLGKTTRGDLLDACEVYCQVAVLLAEAAIGIRPC
jgi:hypothetical protein